MLSLASKSFGCIPLVLTVCNILIIFATTVWPFVIFFSHPGCIGWDWMVWRVRKSQGNSTCVCLDHTNNVCTGFIGTTGTMQGKAQNRPRFRGDAWVHVVLRMRHVVAWCQAGGYYLFRNYHCVQSSTNVVVLVLDLKSERCHPPRAQLAHANHAINTIDAELTTIQTKELASVPELWFTALVVQSIAKEYGVHPRASMYCTKCSEAVVHFYAFFQRLYRPEAEIRWSNCWNQMAGIDVFNF